MALGKLNFLLVEGERHWYARCLEFDFVTQAETLDALLYEIERAIVGHITISEQLGQRPFEGLRRAKPEEWERFERSKALLQPRKSLIARPATPQVEELRLAPTGT